MNDYQNLNYPVIQNLIDKNRIYALENLRFGDEQIKWALKYAILKGNDEIVNLFIRRGAVVDETHLIKALHNYEFYLNNIRNPEEVQKRRNIVEMLLERTPITPDLQNHIQRFYGDLFDGYWDGRKDFIMFKESLTNKDLSKMGSLGKIFSNPDMVKELVGNMPAEIKNLKEMGGRRRNKTNKKRKNKGRSKKNIRK
jgi:hypothetical protein